MFFQAVIMVSWKISSAAALSDTKDLINTIKELACSRTRISKTSFAFIVVLFPEISILPTAY
jgi:hypothetical protein